MKQQKEKEIKAHARELDKVNYTTHETRHGTVKISKGVAYLIEKLNAGWLLNIIVKAQADESVKRHRIQYWEVQKLKFKKGILVYATNGSKNLLFSEIIHYAEYVPVSLWLIDGFLSTIPQSIPE